LIRPEFARQPHFGIPVAGFVTGFDGSFADGQPDRERPALNDPSSFATIRHSFARTAGVLHSRWWVNFRRGDGSIIRDHCQ
jgi:hypothetical protein